MQKHRILIVDDDPDDVKALQRHLEEQGYIVASAFSAEDALANAAGYRPEALIVDVGSPTIDAMNLIERVRDASSGAMVTLAANSRRRQMKDSPRCVSGVDVEIHKPFQREEHQTEIVVMLRRFFDYLERANSPAHGC